MISNFIFGVFATAISQWTLPPWPSLSFTKPLFPSSGAETSTSSIVFSRTWDVLGPFQIGTREAAWPSSDSLTYSGGFHNLKCDPAAEYPSSITPNGTVRWSQSRLDDDSGLHHAIDKDSTRARGTLEVGFPNVDWSALQAVYGWAALQYQAWARGTLFVSTQGSKGKTALVPVALYSDQVLELWIDDTPHFGGDFYSSRRAPLVLWLTPGSHLLELRLIRDVRSMGGAWRVEPVIKVTLEARELRGPNAGAPLLGIADDGDGIRSSVLPDLLEDIGRVSSNLGSVALRNDHLEWISVWDISSTDSPSADIFCFVEDVFEISLLQRLGPIRLAPGQTRPVPFAIKLKKKNDFRSNSLPTLSIIIEFAIGDVDGEEQNNERLNAVHTFTLRKVTSMYEPHKITFLHPSGIVSYAVLRPPAQNATCAHAPKRDDAEKIPILLNLHGAGLEADSPQVAHTLDPLPRLCAWALFPTGVTPWSSDDWHNWGFADVEAAIAAIPTWTENADWNGPAADLDRWLVSGHSNGGQGVWFALTHRPDKIIAATPVSGYLSIDAYVPYTLRMEMDPSMTHNLRAALNDYKHEMLVENVAGIPILQQHGSGDDNVPVYHSRRMHELIGRTGIHSEYFELDGAPHWFDGVMTTNRLSAFYEKHLDGAFTISQVPEQFAIMIANPGSMGSKGGIVVDQLMSPDHYGRIDVSINSTNSVWTLRTRNIRRFHLTPNHASQRSTAGLLIDGKRAALKIDAFENGESWFVQSANGFWKWSNDVRWRSLSERFEGQSGTLDAFLNSQDRFSIVYEDSNSIPSIAVDVSRQLYQYFGADSEISHASPEKNQGLKMTKSSGNAVHILMGAHGAQHYRCDVGASSSFCMVISDNLEEHDLAKSEGQGESVQAFRIQDSADTARLCHIGPDSGAIFLQPMINGRLALVVWGSDLESVRRAARLIPSMTGVGQPDFIILKKSQVIMTGFFDYKWRASEASSLSCPLASSESGTYNWT